MKKWIVAALVIALALLFVMALPSRQSATVPPPSAIPALAPAALSPTTFTVSSTSFEEVLSAHGGRKEIAAFLSIRAEKTQSPQKLLMRHAKDYPMPMPMENRS